MKKVIAMLLVLTMMFALCACGNSDNKTTEGSNQTEVETTQGEEENKEVVEVPFEVGDDATEYVIDGASGWTVQTVNVKIVSGEDVLYNGTVNLTSDDQFVSEVTYAAIVEAGISQDGVQAGFINSIGDYVSGTNADGDYMYWSYTVNGKYVPLASNQMRVLEGDYILWEFIKYDENLVVEPKPSGMVAPFEVGSDATEYTVDGSSGWTSATVNVKIVSGEDILYNGTVTLTSDMLAASEYTYAAIVEAGISQDGVQAGFINSIGDYVAGTNAEGIYMFWSYTVNGKYVPFACNQMALLDGDYLLWEYIAYEE